MNRGLAIAGGVLAGAAAALMGSRALDATRAARVRDAARADDLAGSSEARAKDHAQALERHAREPVDPAWSADMTALVTRGLERAARRGRFAVTRIDCRSLSCAADLEWPARADAQATYAALVQALPELPCSRELVLEAANATNGRFASTLLLECRPP